MAEPASLSTVILYLILFICFYFYQTGACQIPEIVDEILPEVKEVGHEGMLNCTVIHTTLENSVSYCRNKSRAFGYRILGFRVDNLGFSSFRVIKLRENSKTRDGTIEPP